MLKGYAVNTVFPICLILWENTDIEIKLFLYVENGKPGIYRWSKPLYGYS